MEEYQFEYKYKEDYDPSYANGAFGGVTIRGEIIINFYLERQQFLKEHSNPVNGNEVQNPINVVPADLQSRFVRSVHSGVVMNLADAKSLHDWLGSQIAYLDKVAITSK